MPLAASYAIGYSNELNSDDGLVTPHSQTTKGH